MANRYLFQFRGAFQAGIVSIYNNIAIGGTGAPSLVDGQNKGIASVVRNSPGNYTINLMDPYVRVMKLDASFLAAAAPAAPIVALVTDDSANSAAPSITLQCYNASGVATDPASGENLMIKLDLCNSST